jgi:hypothetical protein
VEPRWQFATGNPYAVSPVLSTGKILIDDFAMIRTVDVVTGETHLTIGTVGNLLAQVMSDQLQILTFEVIEQNTTIREYHMETGEQTAIFSIPYPISSLYWAPDARDMIFHTTNPEVLTTNIYRLKLDAIDSPQYLTTIDGTRIGWAKLNPT